MKTVPIGEVTEPPSTWNPRATPGLVFDYVDLSTVDASAKKLREPTRIATSEAPSRARQLISAGDVLVSTVRPNLNAVALVDENLEGATASTGFTVLRPKATLYGPYLYHWVRSTDFINEMIRKATGASYPAVSDRIIKHSTLPLPSLDEQRRIAAILDQADAIRTKRREALAHLDTLTQSIFHEMFGALPIADATVGDAGLVQAGLQVSSKRASLPLRVPYLRVANVHRGRLDLDEVKMLRVTEREAERTRLEGGDLLIVEGHANPMEIGRVAIWTGNIESCVHQNHLIRVRLDPSSALPEFVCHWLNSERGAAYLRRASNTTSGLNTISTSTVRSAPLPLPPLEAQKKFARTAHAFDAHRARVEDAASADDELFASLQSRAFRGEL